MVTKIERTHRPLKLRDGEALLADGKGPNAMSTSCEDRVTHRWCQRWESRFTESRRRIVAIDEMNLDLRRARHSQNWILVEVALLNASILEGHR